MSLLLAELAKKVDLSSLVYKPDNQVSDICLMAMGFSLMQNRDCYISIVLLLILQLPSGIAQSKLKNFIWHVMRRYREVSPQQLPVHLTIMVGGSNDNFLTAEPILQAMGKKIVHAGLAAVGRQPKFAIICF